MSDEVKDPTLEPDEGVEQTSTPDGELEILRSELSKAHASATDLQTQADDFKNKWLRSRAELDNYRRRAVQDVDRAREAGMDSALLTVMSVYDDLGRALAAADEADPSKIVPGIRAVRESLERNLDTLGLKKVGKVGETFDPDIHEALTAMPTENPEQAGKIADVFEVGFTKGERLVRPARVVVYQ
ncbi:nucleotide exchange factor GrpE [soil metagenome]